MNNLEAIWNSLLSRNPEEIQKIFAGLDPVSKNEVLNHLKIMISETGWHPEQVKSARIALEALTQRKESGEDN